ncbi:RNA polymerase sigma factor [Athalassotoga saccharophila]|uniref:RNA polymerase sigma factor n=1 Tax=Athalassotoga saccharophila TaxID=1441386 RepID=UPI001379E0D9|nr:sigma-70 family RNA polymerase sigma factor [Athalassotoga saccharophila]BBJ27311.1 RNA polymerase sigma factor RpoE [Athalassotoga saccharophila]
MEEQKLIEGLKRSDSNAYSELYREYAEKIGGIARSYLGVDDVEDVVQEVFIKIYKNIKKFRGDSSLSTWVYRITVNVCKDMLGKKQRRREILTNFGEQEDEDTKNNIREPVDDSMPSDELMKTLSAEEISKAIDSLSKEDKLLINLREIEGMSYEQIAEIMDKPVGTVKSRLHYARERLKNILESKLGIEGEINDEV